jgi:sodium transport system permease protein
VVAVDATAGEKEKGTLEALLMAPVPLWHLALGKTLATVAMALLSGISGLVGLASGRALAAEFGGRLFTETGQTLELGGQLILDGTSFLALFLSAFLLALFMGAVMVSLGLFARSFKEAQSYMAPLQLLVLLPLIFLQFRGFFELQTWHHLVPLFNVALLMDALLKGSASPLQAGLTWGSTLVYAGLALLVAVRVFSREEVVFRN